MSTSASTSPAATLATLAKEARNLEGIAMLMESMEDMFNEPEKKEETTLSKSQKKRKAKAKSKAPPQAQRSSEAARSSTYKISDDAVDRAVRAFPVEEGFWQRNCSSNSNEKSSLSSGYALSAASVQKLVALNVIVSRIVKPDIPPLERVRQLMFIDSFSEVDSPAFRPIRSRTVATLTQALDELDEASMERLLPELQVLKRGLDEMPISNFEWRRVERQVNELLRAEGEPDMQLPTVLDRMDRSLPIPTRIAKTTEEKKQQREDALKRLKELRLSKPRLGKKVDEIIVAQEKRIAARTAAEDAKKAKAATASTAANEPGQADEKIEDAKIDTHGLESGKVEIATSD